MRLIHLGEFYFVHLPFGIMELSLLFYSFESFSQLMVFHRSLSDSKSPIVSWTHLSILADLNNALVLMVFTHALIFNSFSSFTNSLHRLFCCVYSCLVIVLMALLCSAFRRDSICLSRFPFLNHIRVFSYEISLVCRLKCPQSCFSAPFFGYSCSLAAWVVCSIFVAVISLPPQSLESSSCFVDASTLS